uniref:Transmembrane protein 144 n=1 Tax=Panagrolaimus sp. PS1159 TaxID=55785 RepID=A0AC35F7U1_9BILA
MSAFIVGLVQLLISVVLFGSTFVPVKKYNSGDGVFAQWIMSVAIMFVGFGIHASQGFIHFYPAAMLGGVFWSLGNMMAIPIIKRLGLALGLLIWNVTSCMFGWIIGTYGGFGITARPASIMWLSYIGLGLIFIGGLMFTFVKNKAASNINEGTFEVYKVANGVFEKIHIDDMELTHFVENVETTSSISIGETETKFTKAFKAVGIFMAIISGACFGMNILPVIHVQDNHKVYPDAPQEGLPYVFSHFSGAFITSTIGFLAYTVFKSCRKSTLQINPKVTIPALVSGLLWAIGQALLINSTSILSASITYPISAMLPGCVAAVWSILYFREIEKGKSLALLLVAILITLCGAICIGVSK